MNGNINLVIGSWGSYIECNERALGSKWLDLSDYSDWDEIVEELKKVCQKAGFDAQNCNFVINEYFDKNAQESNI